MTGRVAELPSARPPASGAASALRRVAACRRLEVLIAAGGSLAAGMRLLKREDPGLPSEAALRRWWASWREGGAEALADGRRGRSRRVWGWEARATELWSSPNRPSRATVAHWLREEGFASATAPRVRRWLDSLPASVGGEDAPARAGRHWHKQNVQPYVLRDSTVLDAGLVWQGDGHTCDVYVQHPSTGRHWRPELTVWLDVRTNCCVGWHLSEAESAVSTLHSLAKAFTAQDHVPAALHVDPGSGFRNTLLGDDSAGWLEGVGASVIEALPGNARGKGLVEGWFRWFEERCGKRFSSWCGHARTDGALRRIERSIAEGRVRVPALAEFAAAVGDYAAAYNAAPQADLGGAPGELWERLLVRSPVEMPEAMLVRPSERRKVRRGGLWMFGRLYRAPELHMVEGMEVQVEYDLADDRRVWVNLGRRRVCEAAAVERRPWATASRIEDYRARRAAGRRTRLERRLMEAEAQERPAIEAGGGAEAPLPLEPPAGDGGGVDPFGCLPEG